MSETPKTPRTQETQVNLSIPNAKTLQKNVTTSRTEQQKALIEQKFSEIQSDSVEFDTDFPLTEEICEALEEKGYSYSYRYANGKCNVNIYVAKNESVRPRPRSLQLPTFSPLARDFYYSNRWPCLAADPFFWN